MAVIVTAIFLIWGTIDQKREFIDLYILQKHAFQNRVSCIIVISGLVAVILFGGYYCRLGLKMRKEENNRIGREKSELQALLIGKGLESSE